MKRYYNETTGDWYTEGNSLTIRIGNTLFSGIPTVEQLTEWGYEPYVEPVHVPTLDELKENKIAQIREYDSSQNVNEFIVNGQSAWFDKETRSNFRGSLSDAELLEETEVSVPINGAVYTIPIQNAKLFLAQIQRYADTCTLVSASHISQVQAMTTKEAVNGFDITADYPQKLTFTIE